MLRAKKSAFTSQNHSFCRAISALDTRASDTEKVYEQDNKYGYSTENKRSDYARIRFFMKQMQREICQISEKTNNFALQNQLINHAVEGVTEAAVKVSLLLF